MLSEYKFKQVALEVRKMIYEKFPYYNSPISQKERRVRDSSYGKCINVTSGIILHQLNECYFHLTMYGFSGRFAPDKGEIIDMFIDVAEKKNVIGFLKVSDEDTLYALGENAKKMLPWFDEIPELNMNYKGEVSFSFNEECHLPKYNYRLSIKKEPAIIIYHKESSYKLGEVVLKNLSSVDDIQKFIDYNIAISEKMNREGEKLKNELLVSYKSSVEIHKEFSFYLVILGKKEYIRFSRSFHYETGEECFHTFVFDEYLQDTSLDKLISSAKMKYEKHIKENRIRNLMNVKKSAEVS